MRPAWPALAVVLLVAGLAGCAGRVLPCNGLVTALPISIEPDHPDPALSKEIAGLLELSAACVGSRYDPATEQGRWSYWVELRGTQSEQSRSRYEFTFHLTHLYRNVINYLDYSIRELRPAASLQEFKLDALRADLHIRVGDGLMFPCAETLNPPALGRLRAQSALYRVERTYTGDITVRDLKTNNVQFVPVRVAFEVDFLLEKPSETLADASAREKAPRLLEWARIAAVCETCRPLVLCESLGRPIVPVADPFSSQVHVMAGLEKKPVTVDAVLAQRKRTMVCTRWTPVAGTKGTPILRYSDNSDQGLPSVAPYLTFHHMAQVAEDELCPGKWTVEILLAEILDAPEDLVPGPASAARRSRRERDAVDACQRQEPVYTQTITVPALDRPCKHL